jgi:hypothetical protein
VALWLAGAAEALKVLKVRSVRGRKDIYLASQEKE